MDLPAVKIERAMKGLDLKIVRSRGFPACVNAENETKQPHKSPEHLLAQSRVWRTTYLAHQHRA